MLITTLLALAGAAQAETGSVSLEINNYYSNDTHYDALFNDNRPITSSTLRGEYNIVTVPGLTAVASLGRGSVGAKFSQSYDEEVYYDDEDGDSYTSNYTYADTSDMRAALDMTSITAGARYYYQPHKFVRAYGNAELSLNHGRFRIDEDSTENDNLNQFSYGDVATGAIISGGIELTPITLKSGWKVALYGETGVASVRDFEFVDGDTSIGSMGVSEVFNRYGVKLRL